jgi:hypothetical protein
MERVELDSPHERCVFILPSVPHKRVKVGRTRQRLPVTASLGCRGCCLGGSGRILIKTPSLPLQLDELDKGTLFGNDLCVLLCRGQGRVHRGERKGLQ